MVSSLAAQLSQGVSLNASLLVDRSKRKWADSYLFTGRDADQHDLESIHALGVNGLTQLKSLQPSLGVFEDMLFSDATKNVDRTLLSVEENADLDRTITAFLRELGPYLMETPTSKVLEWIVRRFRINEFNVQDVLLLFLPYHESPHFAKMLTILLIKEQSSWSFLLPFKAAAKTPPRTALVTEMLKNTDVARSITSLLSDSLEAGTVHRTLLCFHTSVMLEFITRVSSFDAGTIAYLLPALLEPLKDTKIKLRKDNTLSSYVLLSALSQKCSLSPKALKRIVAAMIHSGDQIDTVQLLTALIAVLSSQDVLDQLPLPVIERFLKLRDIPIAIQTSLNWSGIEKFLRLILPDLILRSHEEARSSLLEEIMTNAQVPAVLINQAARQIIESLLSENVPNGVQHMHLLSIIHQRHPSVFHGAIVNFAVEVEGSQPAIDQLLLDLSLPPAFDRGRNQGDDVVMTSMHADAAVRAVAVREILLRLSENSHHTGDMTPLQEALKARFQDTSPVVLEAVYDTPQTLLPIISTAEFVTSFGKCLAAQDPARSVLRAHLNFFCNLFCTANPTLCTRVFQDIVFGYLLFTKPRQRTVSIVWEILSDSPLGKHELLNGTMEIVERTQHEDGRSRSAEEMAVVNMSLTSKVAENILASNEYARHLDWLIAHLPDTDTHTRLLSHLIVRSLLGHLSGEHQVDAAIRILDSMDLSNFRDLGKVVDVIDDQNENKFEIDVSRSIVLKPNSRTTTQRLQASIIMILPTIPRPPSVIVDWLFHGTSDKPDTRSYRFLHLMRTVYCTVNLTSSSSALTITQSLFINLGYDSLLFLAGIWTQPVEGQNIETLKYIALRHAAAFLQAQPKDEPEDFQGVLPALVCTLQSSDRRVRTAAVECIRILSSSSSAKKASAIYAYDRVYAAASSSLQYLDWVDISQYLHILSEHGEHMINDNEYSAILHQDLLSHQKADSKKESRFKQRVICFLLSHIISCPTGKTKLTIMRSIRHVKDSVKAQMLLPVVEASLEVLERQQSNSESSEFLTLALASFDATAAKDLNDVNGESWPVFLKVLRCFHPSGHPSAQWTSVTSQIRDGLFDALSKDRQLEVCIVLLGMGSSIDDPSSNIKNMLNSLIIHASLMTGLLTSLQPKPRESNPRAFKRARLDSTIPDTPDNEDTLPSLTFLAEILSSKKLPGSFELISCLLETLNRVATASATDASDMSYIEQLLMTSIDSASSEIKELPNPTPRAVRLDILVELMRVSENPQTFHQALLLMAALTRLAPESVLHNVMPIFTFMGSNVFHRDDSYSFRVIRKTIESIVPIMTDALKEMYSNPLDLFLGSRDFLRVFTEASTHIPRHRRTSFFTHLVDALGPIDFLAPVCMLLSDKVSNRVIRQDTGGSEISLSLPLAILQHYPAETQILSMREALNECRRLLAILGDPATSGKTFLEALSDDEHPVAPPLLRKRQSFTLITFVGHGMQHVPPSQDQHVALQDIISLLLDFVKVQANAQASVEGNELERAARWSLLKSLNVISAADFLVAVLSILQSGHEKIKEGALDLLVDRLPAMTTTSREALSPTIIQLIGAVKALLSSTHNTQLIASALTTLRSIGLTICHNEEGPLTESITLVLDTIRDYPGVVQAMAVLPTLIIKLGPRVLPHFRRMVESCVVVLEKAPSTNQQTLDEGVNVLTCLLNSLSNFWGSLELKPVISLCLDHDFKSAGAQSGKLDSVMKAMAKRIPGKTLLPTLCQIWPSIQATQSTASAVRVGRFFDLLKRGLRAASRADALGNLRPLCNLFIEALDLRTTVRVDDIITVEDKVISACLELVVKLNESAFQPFFRRLHDWALGDGTSQERKITFCRLYSALLELFKGLMTPYMSLLLNSFVGLLEAYGKGAFQDHELWLCIVDVLFKSFSYDEGVFWRDEKIRRIISPVIEQIPVCIQLKIWPGKTLLPSCLNAMTDIIEDDLLLKALNLGILMHTRSEDSRVRLFALTCAVSVWQDHGRKLVGLVAETATFIVECAEDENDDVVKETHKLKNAVEAETGAIDGL